MMLIVRSNSKRKNPLTMVAENSSVVGPSANVTDGPSAPHKWDLPGPTVNKLPNWDYGYVSKGGEPHGCSLETLVRMISSGVIVSGVWSPDTPGPVPAERAPFLLHAFRSRVVRYARNAVLVGLGILGVIVVIAVAEGEWRLIYQNYFSLFGVLVLAEGIWEYSRSRRYTEEDAVSDASTALFTEWLQNKNLSGYTIALVAAMIAVSGMQVFADDAINRAALVKPAVWNGEVWRLFTSTLMHADVTHFWMNFLFLLHIAKIVEQTLARAFVPLIFVITGALGSVFSMLLYPNSTSIGASGGLLGLLGFITIAAYFDRDRYPPLYFRRMIAVIILIGLMGLFGFAFIDNAGHLGGLVGGLLLGWFFLRSNHKARLIKVGGVSALFALVVIALTAIYHMLG